MTTDVPWLSEREAAAWQAVRDLGQPLWTALGRDLQRESGLSLADYQILVVLSAAPEDSMAYRDLVAATNWEKSRLSHQISRMERRNLLRREDQIGDLRCANVVLTADGRHAIEAAAPGHVTSVRRLLIGQLSAEQLDALIAVGEQVRDAIADHDTASHGMAGHDKADHGAET